MCVFGSSRVESGPEPVEESYDFDTTQENPSLDPSVGFYPGEPLYLCYLYFDALPLSIILALLRCFVDTNPICMFPATSYYLIPTSYKPLFVYMLALRVLVHAQETASPRLFKQPPPSSLSALMSTHASILVDSVGPLSAEVCRTAASFP